MGKFEKASVEERILHSTNTLKYCERGTEAIAEGWAVLHITTRSSQEKKKGDTETHPNQVQTKILQMTNILAKPFIFT